MKGYVIRLIFIRTGRVAHEFNVAAPFSFHAWAGGAALAVADFERQQRPKWESEGYRLINSDYIEVCEDVLRSALEPE